MGDPLRLCIVGTGWAGTRIGQAVAELDGSVVVTALVDPDADQRDQVATELGVAAAYGSLHEALRDVADAVVIASPHSFHASHTLEAIDAGMHVLVEKPIALTLADADRMVQAAEVAGVVLSVAENEAYEPWVDELRAMVARREPFGQLAFAVITAGHRSPESSYPGRRSWLTEPDAGGTGSWVLHGIHTVATCRRILGEVDRVFALEHRTSSYGRDDLEATMSVLLAMDDGTPVTLVQTPEVDLGTERKSITLYGDQGVMRADRVGWSLHRPGVRPPVAETGLWEEGEHSSYALEVAAFAAAIRDGTETPTSGRSERQSLAVVLAALDSVRTKMPVTLGDLGS